MKNMKKWLAVATVACSAITCGADPVKLGMSRVLWVDDGLVEKMTPELSFRLHHPRTENIPGKPVGFYMTILKDGGKYRAYYRQYLPSHTGEKFQGSTEGWSKWLQGLAAKDPKKYYDNNPGEYTAYAESDDGVNWKYPDLDLVKLPNDPDIRNCIIHKEGYSHNFTPFIDTAPGCPPEERYKALGGHANNATVLVSPDGLRWTAKKSEGLIKPKELCFDSQNIAFYSHVEGLYVLYVRNLVPLSGENMIRSAVRLTSKDFINWSEPERIGPNLPGEHLYTFMPSEYFRAPDYVLALPTRFTPATLRTDILFMSAWRSKFFKRQFTEAIIRPGKRLGNRDNYMAAGLLPCGEREMMAYHALAPTRYVWRLDGFVSLHAGAKAGEIVTVPLIFEGDSLSVNADTATAGGVAVEILDESGKVIPGFGRGDCEQFVGDETDHVIRWKNGKNLAALAGKTVKLRFIVKEADFYSFKFGSGVVAD